MQGDSLGTNALLIGNGGAIGIFSNATVSVQLRESSTLPERMSFTVQKGYRAILLPEGAPAEFPAWKKDASSQAFRIHENIYHLKEGMLYRFSSESAALSRFDPSDIIDGTDEILTSYPIADEWIGFRPGTLVSFADGVFVIYSDSEMRPIGSAKIFETLGYDWNDVIPGSEEDISLFKRGRIILPGALHAPGTLFRIIETSTFFTIDERNMRRPITDPLLLSFYLKRTHAIPVSEESREITSFCELRPSIFSSHRYHCMTSLQNMSQLTGSDYQFTLTPSADINIESMTVTIDRSPGKENFRSTLSQLKANILDRYSSP